MSARKVPTVSLRVAHSRKCANANKTALDSLKGCTCQPGPSYYTLYTPANGRPVKGERVRSKDEAERQRVDLQSDLYQQRGERDGSRKKSMTFNEWVDKWAGILEMSGQRKSTRIIYLRSTDYARTAFGHMDMREIGNEQLRELVAVLREDMQDVSVAKHLRHLSVCFTSALDEGYIDTNPVQRFKSRFKLDVRRPQANYFDNGEIERLWRQLAAGIPFGKDRELRPVAPVYLALCKFAVATGARLGELIALTWGDIRLGEGHHGVVRIDKSWSPVNGLTGTKTGRDRIVSMAEDARGVLMKWAQLTGAQDDEALVFPSPRDGGYLDHSRVTGRVLNPALAAAGIPKVGPDSPEIRDFHTFRHCFARIMLERGQTLQWVSRELGHATIKTTEIYSHWAKQAQHDAVLNVPAGTFPV